MSSIRPNALAIIKSKGRVLACKGVNESSGKVFFRVLGGGIDFGELAVDALRREFKEELNATIINEVLLCTAENIFEYNGEQGHEITFLYQADLQEQHLYDEVSMPILDNNAATAEWVPISEVRSGAVILYPTEAIQYL
jgi:ADP-ribose pyrophosphatase YjhB (NUDIX family)